METQKVYHPVLIALGHRGEVNEVFLAVKDNALPVPLGIVAAVERMMKLHFIANMQFAMECRHILHFLQRACMKLSDDLPLSRGAADLSLYIRSKKSTHILISSAAPQANGSLCAALVFWALCNFT